ncbi:MAG: polyprotein [Candidatus Amesbacteria bacterium GW2011_GWA2_42_12]|uniref:Polyprotein n=1 Tax=Candidatus Amesbacteria bacterium GW2011_GWA2_42_12 TaxID=1618356 RepID=A0A0G0Y8V7_9BACT|nr:MAG: polyprotein [Candidatus Amesbacteria bacterium GW2011_GWA2_42_12]
MKNKIVFSTTNAGKIAEAAQILGVEIVPSGLEIPEIQSLDSQKVALQKALDYYKELNTALLVEDVSLVFKALNGLPGPYINDFSKVLGNSGLIRLLKNATDRTATAITTLVYCDQAGDTHVFQGIINGSISAQERGTNGFGWDPIFIPEGHDKTFAEMDNVEKNSLSMRAIALHKFKSWLDK